MSTVSITHSEDIEAGIREALSLLELDGLFEGKLVAVKPNETWASVEDRTAVTQPDTLRAVLREVKSRRPREVVVSGGAGAAETAEVMRVSEMMEVIEAEGVEFFDHNRPPFTEVELEAGPQKTVYVNRRVLEYETLVALNQLKVHASATVTMALKNIAMSFPAAEYYGYPRSTEQHEHRFFDDLQAFIAAMAKAFPIHLAVTVGHPAMVGTGPIGGHTFETGLTIASQDPLAADVVGAQILGFDVQGVRHLWEAARLGVGESAMEKIEIRGVGLEKAIEIFRKAAYG